MVVYLAESKFVAYLSSDFKTSSCPDGLLAAKLVGYWLHVQYFSVSVPSMFSSNI